MADQGIHPFEQAGLGRAPFRFTGTRVNVYSAAPGHSQPGGTCAYCGQGIKYECWITSYDGQRFAVGQDCVWKLSRADNRLATDLKRALAIEAAEKREAARMARQQAWYRAREEALDRQRAANGGLTNAERAAKERADAIEAGRAEWTAKNQWLIDVAKSQGSEFCGAMASRLEVGPVSALPDRAVNALRDIYARLSGRRGSKGYDAAAERFDTLAFGDEPGK